MQRLGGILELHRVRLFGSEIDGHLADQKIQRIDLAETPALVNDVSAGLELIEDLAGFGGELAGVDRLLDFGMHGLAKIGVGGSAAKHYLGIGEPFSEKSSFRCGMALALLYLVMCCPISNCSDESAWPA
ncbi:MAG: hypothetical protein WDN28_23935 [Chthoniobacter sp.]